MGCNKKEEAAPQAKAKQEMQHEVPKALTELQKSTEEIIKELDKVEQLKVKAREQQGVMQPANETLNDQGNEAGEQNQQDSGQQDRNQRKQQKTQSQVIPQQQMQQDLLKQWATINTKVDELNVQWNSYEPEALKAGVAATVIENFESALNDLTDKAALRDQYGAILAANHLTRYIPDFLEKYTNKTPPDLQRLSFYTREILLNARADHWESAQTNVTMIQTIWRRIEPIVPPQGKTAASKFDLSLSDLENVVQATNANLVKVKGNIVLKNIEELRKAFEEKK